MAKVDGVFRIERAREVGKRTNQDRICKKAKKQCFSSYVKDLWRDSPRCGFGIDQKFVIICEFFPGRQVSWIHYGAICKFYKNINFRNTQYINTSEHF